MVKMMMGCRKLDIIGKNLQGQNACHIAAIHGQLPVLKFLLHKSEAREKYNEFH